MRAALAPALVGALVAGPLAAAPAASQQPPPAEAEVDAVLRTSQIESVLASLEHNVMEVLPDVAPSLDGDAGARLGAALADAFSPERLYPDVVSFIRGRSADGEVAALSAWLLADDFRALEARTNADVMPESIESFAQRLEAAPPPRRRFELVARMVQAQHAGEFYVATADRLRGAVERVVDASVAPGTAVPVVLTREEEAARLDNVRVVSFISFMQRLEPLTDDEAERMVAAWESDSGQWWVLTYTDAILAAIEAAEARAVGR